MFAPGRISVAFFGDGGGNQGAFHEAMNLAAVWKLPVIFVCENNHYAISTHVETSTSMGTFYQRAAGYGIPGVLVNGNDAVAVYEAAAAAADRARRGEGPTFIECDTYRFRGHHEGDEQTYRSREEVNAVKENNDCIQNMKKLLVEAFGWTAEEDQAVYQSVTQQVDAAVAFGMESPAMKVEDMLNHLFEEGSV
jgi:pyruvate dehydrogenase E1 component alpha subunit